MHKFEDVLRILCTTTTTKVFAYLKRRGFTVTKGKNRYAYKPGKCSTSPLIVCHADTVRAGGEEGHSYAYKDGVANSIALDDRLGITAMLYMLDNCMGDCAALVCDNEEIGQSTAQQFNADSSPNWMVELDRRGTDVVCYEYDTPLLRGMLEWADFKVGRGSFSDICYLDHLGVCGFNVGVGYQLEHTDQCHANLTDTFSQLTKLKKFYSKFKDVPLNYEPTRYKYDYRSSTALLYDYDDDDYTLDSKYKATMADDSDEDYAIQEWLFDNDVDTYEALYTDRATFANAAREVWIAAGRPSLTRYY